MGFGAKRVKRLEVIELAIFPVQFPVEFRVYVAFKFMKRPDVMGMGVVTFATEILAWAVTSVERFDVPVTLRVVANDDAAFKVVTLVVDKLDVP
jgi:hypothetical protein